MQHSLAQSWLNQQRENCPSLTVILIWLITIGVGALMPRALSRYKKVYPHPTRNPQKLSVDIHIRGSSIAHVSIWPRNVWKTKYMQTFEEKQLIYQRNYSGTVCVYVKIIPVMLTKCAGAWLTCCVPYVWIMFLKGRFII